MKNSEYILYLDMDEVISDFNGGYESQYDALHDGEISLTEFFATLEWTGNGKILWREVSKLFSNIRILSTSNAEGEEHEETVLGKKMWIKRNLKTVPEDHIFVVEQRRYKALYAAENSILVDDLSDTIREWDARGGIGILHSDSHVYRTIDELERLANPNRSKFSEMAKSLPIVTRGFWNRK